ncbi:Unknown protein, partial [Striga hermonthica]
SSLENPSGVRVLCRCTKFNRREGRRSFKFQPVENFCVTTGIILNPSLTDRTVVPFKKFLDVISLIRNAYRRPTHVLDSHPTVGAEQTSACPCT